MLTKLLKFFPPPKLLTRPAVGLDISDQSVKFVELTHEEEKYQLRRFAEITVPVGVIEAGIIKKPDALVAILTSWRLSYGLKNIVVALPEELAYLVRLNIPTMPFEEIKGAIELQLDQYVPLPVKDIIFDYEIVPGKNYQPNITSVVVSVLTKQESSQYYDVLRKSGFQPLAFEIESQALTRVCLVPGDEATVLIIDIGKSRTGISVVSRGVVSLTSTVPNIGGRDMTRNIERSSGVSSAEAEMLKKEKGLSQARDNEPVFTALIPLLSSLKDELDKTIEFWKKDQKESLYHERPIERVVVCGGQASLPGLAEYLAGQLDLPVSIGNPWINTQSIVENVPPLPFEDSLRFSTAIGLALRAATPNSL